ncbi:hypothetical protein [Paenibacillus sp. WLX2291]|uniref:hypothetical protein n=1 Tax=Paenibacillus sp. WLX2291 TaxID=3296934 RepID=UPI0039841691
MLSILQSHFFYLNALFFIWVSAIVITPSILGYKNRSPRLAWWTFVLGPLFPIVLFLIPKNTTNNIKNFFKDNEQLFASKVYQRAVWSFRLNNSDMMALYMKMLRTSSNINIDYVESIVKIAVEKKKNTAWTTTYVSVIVSFSISLFVSILGKFIGVDVALISNITDAIFSLILWLLICISTMGAHHRHTYNVLLHFQEAIRLYRLQSNM